MITIPRHRSTSVTYKNLTLSALKAKYSYLILGAVVIAIILITGLIILTKGGKPLFTTQEAPSGETGLERPTAAAKSYKVIQGDTLWSIAEVAYGSGYNYVDIAAANNITNPDAILADQVIALPQVAAKTPTKTEVTTTAPSQATFKGDTYTVKSGDYLWDIALQAYGDPYAWTKISTANNLINPDLIYPDTKLAIPR